MLSNISQNADFGPTNHMSRPGKWLLMAPSAHDFLVELQARIRAGFEVAVDDYFELSPNLSSVFLTIPEGWDDRAEQALTKKVEASA